MANNDSVSRRTYDMFDTTPTPTQFKQQQQQQQYQYALSQQQHQQQQQSPRPTASISGSSSRNSNLYYANNDDWVTSPHPSSSTVTATGGGDSGGFDHDLNDDGDYEVSPNSGTMDDELQQQHMQQLFDKKRRRRESHNAVERRRRDNINERIFELSTLLPERDATKNNKGTILRKSVDHIRMLHEQVTKCQHRIQELENMLGMYRMRGPTGGTGAVGAAVGDLNPIPSMMQPGHPSLSFSSSIQPQLAYRRDT